MRDKFRRDFESRVVARVGRLRARPPHKRKKLVEEVKEAKEDKSEKSFAKFYEMSYNELRATAKEKKIKTWRKNKEEIIELLIEQERLH